MFAHRFGSAWEVLAPAKLNLSLDVLGRRADGFHDLESLLVPLRFYDQLRWMPAKNSDASLSLVTKGSATGTNVLSAAADNLVLRAARRLAEVAGIEAHGHFELYKRIPLQAGMGGGSSDAAAALVLANTAWGLNLPRTRLAEIGAEIGSDVPFFFAGGPAVCRGRGEHVQRIDGLPQLHFVVAKPDIGLSTAEVFSLYQKQMSRNKESMPVNRVEALVESLQLGQLRAATKWMVNSLTTAAERLSPIVADLRKQLLRENLLTSMMTGSGSACFGLAASARQAQQVARRLAGRFSGQVFAVSSC